MHQTVFASKVICDLHLEVSSTYFIKYIQLKFYVWVVIKLALWQGKQKTQVNTANT